MLYYHIETHSRSAARKALYPQWSMTRPNVFLYGRGTENRTLINRLKAYYFTVKLYPRHLITLVTIHDRSPFKIKKCSANPGGNYTASGTGNPQYHHIRPPPSPRQVPFSHCQRPFGLKTTTRAYHSTSHLAGHNI